MGRWMESVYLESWRERESSLIDARIWKPSKGFTLELE
jgi:hypothetical protein